MCSFNKAKLNFASIEFFPSVVVKDLKTVVCLMCCVPSIKQNLIFVSKLCKTNNASIVFFPSFVVKDLKTGARLTRVEQE